MIKVIRQDELATYRNGLATQGNAGRRGRAMNPNPIHMSRRAPYESLIKQFAPDSYDPRHIEAFIRLGHSILNDLSREQFRKEVKIAMACIDEVGSIEAEKAAKSFGL